MATRLPGNLAVLPLELVWEIFDHLFMRKQKLDPDYINYMSKLVHAHKNFAIHIHQYVYRTRRGRWIRDAIREGIESDISFIDRSVFEAAACDDDHEPARPFFEGFDPYGLRYPIGLVTKIVMDDCPTGLMLLQNLTPELARERVPIDGTWVNKDGWTLFAVAAFCGSLKMVKYFCSMESPNGSCIPLLARAANVVRGGPSTLMNILCHTDRQFTKELFTFLAPRLHELIILGANGDKVELSPPQKFLLCQLLTVEQVDLFEKCGIPLFATGASSYYKGNVYHAAAANPGGPEFLAYIRQKVSPNVSMVEKDDRNRIPLYNAVAAKRLDTVLWFQANGAVETYDTDEAKLKESWKDTAAYLAADMTCEESVSILREILRPLDPTELPPIFCPLLLQTVVWGVAQQRRVRPNAAQRDRLGHILEMRAIEKCKFIKSKITKDVRRSVKVRKLWMKVVSLAKSNGLNDLAAFIKHGRHRDLIRA